jgi:hypothetical protein
MEPSKARLAGRNYLCEAMGEVLLVAPCTMASYSTILYSPGTCYFGSSM